MSKSWCLILRVMPNSHIQAICYDQSLEQVWRIAEEVPERKCLYCYPACSSSVIPSPRIR